MRAGLGLHYGRTIRTIPTTRNPSAWSPKGLNPRTGTSDWTRMAMRSIAPDLRSRRRCCTPLRLAASLGSSADRSLRNSCPTLAILRLGAMRRIAQELRGPVLRSSHPHELRAALSEPLWNSWPENDSGTRTALRPCPRLILVRLGGLLPKRALSSGVIPSGTPYWTTFELPAIDMKAASVGLLDQIVAGSR